jgi:hypothetical protein
LRFLSCGMYSVEINLYFYIAHIPLWNHAEKILLH